MELFDLRLPVAGAPVTISVPAGHNTILFVRRGELAIGGGEAQGSDRRPWITPLLLLLPATDASRPLPPSLSTDCSHPRFEPAGEGAEEEVVGPQVSTRIQFEGPRSCCCWADCCCLADPNSCRLTASALGLSLQLSTDSLCPRFEPAAVD